MILSKISGDEQPSDMEMHNMAFWVRVYDFPLKLRSESLAKKLGDSLGNLRRLTDNNRLGKFLRIMLDLHQATQAGNLCQIPRKIFVG